VTQTYKDRLRDVIEPLVRRREAEDGPASLAGLLNRCEEFFAVAVEEYRTGSRELVESQPAYGSKIEQYDAILDAAPVPVDTVRLYGSADEATARGMWREQLTCLAGTLHALLADDRETLRASKFIWYRELQPPNPGFAIPMNICFLLREIRKLAILLDGGVDCKVVTPGRQVAGDELAGDVSMWDYSGEGVVESVDGVLRSRGTPAGFWARTPLPEDHLVRFRFRPEPGRIALIFAICGRPVEGLDFSVTTSAEAHWNTPPADTVDNMDPYNHGVHAYHVSAHVPGRPSCHMRRAGNGLRMLSKRDFDPCVEPDRWYEIEMVKAGQTVLFLAEGRLIHIYVDTGTFGPVLSGGHFGIKPFTGGMDRSITPPDPWVSYRDLEIREVQHA